MTRLTNVFILLSCCLISLSCTGQQPGNKEPKAVLSNDFDQSPPLFYKIPERLSSSDTSPGWTQKGQKIVLTGTVYEIDGKTPAANTLLYYYHTDVNGQYATKASEPLNMPKNQLGQTHGYIRGWVKTGKDGKYAIYTVMPGSYPNGSEAAHIHMYVKEENREPPYYIDDFVFDDDKGLTTAKRIKMENRAGSGVIRFVEKDSLWIGERNLILGLNISDLPKEKEAINASANEIGEPIFSFTPYHAYGPDKGTKTCPVCKYGWYHGILYFVGDKPDWPAIEKWLLFLDNESLLRQKYLKVYFVYGNQSNYVPSERRSQLEKLGSQLQLKSVALTFLPSFADTVSNIHLNNINPKVDNTFLIYKRSTIIDKYINFAPTEENFNKIKRVLDQSANQYFKLSRPKME
tara:strand:+ start:2251 stop:3462 length:1212 start_codon:yes stop_codon:yes gene_type:complete